MSEDIDELDELLGLIDEDDEIEEKQQKQIQVAKQQKNKQESESYVCPPIRCKLRVDPTTRAISAESLTLRLRHWSFVSLINLPLKLHNKSVINKEFVVIGILSSKNIKTSKNNNKYLLLKIDDFNASISCFIFNSEIIEKFYKIMEGTVLLLAGPQIMNDKNTQMNNNNNNNISLKIEKNEQILVIGKSIDFAYCNKLLSDGHSNSKCKNVINKSKGYLCTFHKNLQYKKYASRRSDANRGTINLNRNKRSKKSLSGNMGISMIQTRKNKYNKYNNKKDRNTKANRKKTANLILKSSAVTPFVRQRLMKKCVKGSKHILETQKKIKDKEMKKLLIGKPLIPQLGCNWNNNNNNNNNNGVILLNPKPKPKSVLNSQKKAEMIMAKNGIVFDAPNPNDTMNLVRKRRKRQLEEINNGYDNGNVRKKSRLGGIVCMDKGEMDDIINKRSINDGVRMEVEKENMYKEMNDLEEEEKLAGDLGEITSVQINIYICKFRKCALKDKIMEKVNSFCKSHSGNVVKTVGRKYFWRCKNCRFKTFTINKKRVIPKCRNCGGKDFKPASAYTLSKPKASGQEKLILRNNKK